MGKVTTGALEAKIARCAAVGAFGLFLATAAHGQTPGVSATDWIDFDLASDRTSGESLPSNGLWENLNPSATSQPVTGTQNENAMQVRIMPPSNRSPDAHGQARSLAGTPSSGVIAFDDETVSQLDIQLGGSNGLNLTSSFGVTSQPRDASPSDIFFLRGNQVREDRAVARIGVRF